MSTALATSAVDPAIGEAMAVYHQLNALRNAIAPDLNDAELQLFAMVAHHSRLDPFARQIYAVKRQGKVTFQTGIDGFRSSAEETGEYSHSDEPEYSEWIEKPFPHPTTARVTVYRYRNGRLVGQSATARWDSYYPGESQGFQWKKMPDVMLGKCAEALAFRKLFPRRFAGLYVAEEMGQADAPQEAAPVLTARDRAAAARAKVEARVVSPDESARPETANADPGVEPPQDTALSAAPPDMPGVTPVAGPSPDDGPSPGVNAKDFRAWLRENVIGITDALKPARERWGEEILLDELTDAQRAELMALLKKED